MAERMLVEIMNYSGQSLSALEGVVRGLAPLSGRKVVVLVSDGFLIGLGSSDTRHYDLRRIVDAATRSGVVVYALDSRGLVSEVPGGNASFAGPPVITAPGVRESLQSRSIEALRDSLVALSEDTGGFLVKNSNDLSAGLARILRDNQLYYVLGYEPTNKKRDGKFRKIEVRLVSRPELKDLKVRTRRGYFAPGSPRPWPRESRPRSSRASATFSSPRPWAPSFPSPGFPCAWRWTTSTCLPTVRGRW